MLKLEPFPSALLDKREEGKGLGGLRMYEKARLVQCLCACAFFKMFDSKCKICVDDSNSEAPEFPLLNWCH